MFGLAKIQMAPPPPSASPEVDPQVGAESIAGIAARGEVRGSVGKGSGDPGEAGLHKRTRLSFSHTEKQEMQEKHHGGAHSGA